MSRLFASVLIGMLMMPQTLFAVSDSFTIQTLIGADAIPPTTPANVIVTPIATDQIDVVWDASNDNVGVSGYQVFRDAAQIATTTVTNYSDTGLTAETLYSYTIRAFDETGNVSSFSAAAATSTLAEPAPTTTPTTTPPSGGGTGRQLEIHDLVVDASKTSVVITFTTTLPAKSVVRWGRGSSYEDGYVAGEAYKRTHRIVISGLAPGTLYEAEIAVTSPNRQTARKQFRIETQAGEDRNPPANVMNFRAHKAAGGVALSWRNPLDPDFAYVRIVSNDRFYPTDPADGYLVYQGAGTDAFDDRPVTDGVRYYTAFAYDENGNVSSGAVTVYYQGGHRPPVIVPGTPSTTPGLSFDEQNVEFYQLTRDLQRGLANIVLEADEVTTIRIPYDALPEHLKTVVMTLQHPANEAMAFSFLLRVNADKTAYEARIGGLEDIGEYLAQLQVFDFKTSELVQLTGNLIVVGKEAGEQVSAGSILPSQSMGSWGWFWFLVSVTLSLWILWWLLWRRQSREDSGISIAQEQR